ncbi:MAG: Hsp20/alpha crystallin family protein [Balneolales bacterium]|nr:Hsp20/alpha crystallin family protein [Balneolales bacterium]
MNFKDIEKRFSELGEDLQDMVTRLSAKQQQQSGFVPDVDIIRTKDSILLCADLPGMQKSDITIKYRDRVLSVSGNRELAYDVPTDFFKRERKAGSFSRAFTLPFDVNSAEIKASFLSGVLKIEIPAVEDAVQDDTIIIE